MSSTQLRSLGCPWYWGGDRRQPSIEGKNCAIVTWRQWGKPSWGIAIKKERTQHYNLSSDVQESGKLKSDFLDMWLVWVELGWFWLGWYLFYGNCKKEAAVGRCVLNNFPCSSLDSNNPPKSILVVRLLNKMAITWLHGMKERPPDSHVKLGP